MEQHPVPQQISTYQFRLVGDMTLPQFLRLAAGGVFAVIAYSLPINPVVKWPLIIISVVGGFAFAFVPIQERPLSTWVVSFIKSCYSPTIFVWEQQRKIPDFMEKRPRRRIKPGPIIPTDTSAAKKQMEQYLETIEVPTTQTQADKREKQKLENISQMFQTVTIPSTIVTEPQPEIKEKQVPQMRIKPHPLTPPPETKEPLPKTPITPAPQKRAEKKPKKTKQARPPQIKIPPFKSEKKRVQATTSADLPFPTTPDTANIISGMVLDQQGKMVENAIIEIRNEDGTPVRALKTNPLGQFQIATPLDNGAYEIEVEKNDLEFDIIKLKLTGDIIKPIEIRSK